MLRKTARARGQGFDPYRPDAIPEVTGLTLIGAGGSADVYQGSEPAMRRKVAVKVLHAVMRDARERQAFERECALAGQMGEHPYAAEVYRSGFADDRPYIVMRYYTRGSLAASLSAGQQFPVGESLTICAQVATALQFAHNRGILHRDVKPQNILRDALGDPVLADFGIATERDAVATTLRHTMTPAYAPPEVLKDGGGWPHSDVWSLAATLYALLAGHPPFYDPQHSDPRANMRALTGPLPPVRRPDVPPHLQETLARALIGEPDRRTASARWLVEELNTDLGLLGLPPVPIRVDAHDNGHSPVASAAPAAPGFPGAAAPGLTSARPPDGGQQAREYTTGELADAPRTDYLVTTQDYGTPEPKQSARNTVPRPALAVGALLLLIVIAGLAYVLAGNRHQATVNPGQTTASGSATNTASAALSRPTDVTAVAVNGSAARISWKNTEPASLYRDVVISLGEGTPVRAVPNDSPQLITGLQPAKAYCFAVGYVGPDGKPSYSRPACIRGGVPESAG